MERRKCRAGMALAALLVLVLPVLWGCAPRERTLGPVAKAFAPAGETAQYRRLVLPNQLKVMLVSDSAVERAGAALSVGVGSLDDPQARPGLAHFLEHMLFLGTEKYPDPGEYQAYLTSHEGFSNAYTADDHTNFFFEVTPEGFEGALDRFAWFFIAPTFNQGYAEREVKAVDSEHSKNIENDFWRVRQVQRDIYNPAHPINRFSTGNLKTLAGVGNAELRRFYGGEYSANRMALAVVGRRSLDELERLVRQRFERVPDRHLPKNSYPADFLPPKAALRLLSVEPVADQRGLVMEFPLPPTEQMYRSKPLNLIGSVLGDESPGSLLSLLKAENLATSLSAGGGESTASYSSFQIRLALTPEGLQRYSDALHLVLGVIEGLRRTGFPAYRYEENRTMAVLDYRYRERAGAGNLARQLSAQMQTYPLEALPEAVYQLQRFDPQAIEGLLERMRPGNMLVTLIAKGVETDRADPYYNARYSYREVTGEPFETLRKVGPDPRWHPPRQNLFIPKTVRVRLPEGALKLSDTAFSQLEKAGLAPGVLGKLEPMRNRIFSGAPGLLTALETALGPEQGEQVLPQVAESALPLPEKLLDSARGRVWYRPGWRFRQPRAQIDLLIYTAGASSSPREAMLGELYQAALGEALNEYAYPIREAGLSFSVGSHRSGVSLSLGGYSATMLELLRELSARLRRVDISPEAFAAIKESTARGLRNARFDQPYRQGLYYRALLLEHPAFTLESRGAALKGIKLADVQAYAARLYDRVYVEGVVLGNLPPDATRAALRRMLDVLKSRPLPEAERVKREVRLLALDSDFVFNERLPVNNSMASYYYQVGPMEPRVRGALLIIARPLGEQFYFNMRTQQQLGYIVYAGMGQVENILSLDFLVQSGAFPAGELLRRMDGYIPKFVRGFSSIPAAEFEKFRRAVIEAKLERPKGLDDAVGRFFYAAFEKDANWDYVSEDIRAVEALSRAEVEEVLNQYLVGRGTRRLAIRLTGRDHPDGTPAGQPISIPESARGIRR